MPLQKIASPKATRSPSPEDLAIQQSGRSASSLLAEHAAVSIDNGKHSQRPQPHVPAMSSPLKPASAQGTPGDNERRASDESKSSASHPSTSNEGSPERRPQLRPPLQPHKQRSPRELADREPDHPGSPLSVWNLGSDYTRYFSPFSDDNRSSFAESLKLSTPLPRYHTNSRATTPLQGANTKNPFNTPQASTSKLNLDVDTEKNAFLVDDRLGASYTEKGGLMWPLIGDGEEDDDEMHLPSADDDIRYKTKWKDHFSRENIVSTFGLFFMIMGLLFVFIALPILSYSGILGYTSQWSTPLDQMYKPYPEAEAWALVNNKTYPLLKNIRSSLIDPDTPKKAMTKKNMHGEDLVLVFSDEFNDNNRTFYEGDDPYWYAPDIWYGATQDLEWYDPDAVTTWDGVLELRLDKFINHGVNFRSGMLNSWNQLCFKGGIFEVSVSLPGPAAVPGLWPGAWTMGNLGRPGYLSTTEGMWPYTYDSCDVGITPNQSNYDGLSRLPGQRLPSCTCPGEDHPNPGRGRGAPEIDILEAGASYGGLPIATQSYQVAPFDIWYYPDYNFTAFPDYTISYPNGYTGGPFQQAISATTNLNKEWYDGKAYQSYYFEYVPGTGEDAYIAWFIGGQMTWMMDGRAVGPNGNVKDRIISQEPMSMVLNLGISPAWTYIPFEKLNFPTVMRIDYVRLYQPKSNISVTCDPPGWETTKYIKEHMNAYTNPNLTKWEQTGHPWPKHKLNTDC